MIERPVETAPNLRLSEAALTLGCGIDDLLQCIDEGTLAYEWHYDRIMIPASALAGLSRTA